MSSVINNHLADCKALERRIEVLTDTPPLTNAPLDRPQVLLEAPRRRPVDVVARGRAVLDAARGHVEGIRLHM